jgi:hypothetical protein
MRERYTTHVHSASPLNGFGTHVPPQHPCVAMLQPEPDGRQHDPLEQVPSQQSLSVLQPVAASGMQHFLAAVHFPGQQSLSEAHAAFAARQQSPSVHGPAQQSSSNVHVCCAAMHAHFRPAPQFCEQQSLGMAQPPPTVVQQGGLLPA